MHTLEPHHDRADRAGPRARPGARRLVAALLLAASSAAAGALGRARADTWVERGVGELLLRYRPGDEAAADAAAAHVADHWRDLSAWLGAPAGEAPIVRLHATAEDLAAAQPLAREVGGDWLVPSRPRRELSVLVPRPAGSGAGGPFDAQALDAAVHAALARHQVAGAAQGRLPDAFQEGIVRFLALPTEAAATDAAAGVAVLRAAAAAGELPSWSALAAPGGLYDAPELALAASRSIAHYLAERGGVAALSRLPAGAAAGGSWTAALEALFGAPPERLDAGWRAWLPGYLDHGWRWHVLYDGGLDDAERRIAAGDYDGAASQLEAVAGHAARAGGAVAARHADLAARADAGRRAVADAEEAEARLEAGEYAEAARAAASARDRLADLGLATPEAAAAEILERARAGGRAAARLARAESAPGWAALAARRDADAAARDLARLGGDLAARHALAVRARLDGLLQPVGVALCVVGAAAVADAWRRRRQGVAGIG